MIKSVLSVESHIASAFEMHVPYHTNCFELLGYDILIDSNLVPWLLEVNLSPSLNCDSPLDQKIKGQLIADLFTLCGAVSLDRRNPSKGSSLKAGCYHPSLPEANPRNPRNLRNPRTSVWNNCTKPNSSEGLKEAETNEERRVVKETNEEYRRRGNFERIFPSELSVNYKGFFERERPYNVLLCNSMGKIRKKGQGRSAVVYRKPPRA